MQFSLAMTYRGVLEQFLRCSTVFPGSRALPLRVGDILPKGELKINY